MSYPNLIKTDGHIGKTFGLRLTAYRSDQSDKDNLITSLQTSRGSHYHPTVAYLNPNIIITARIIFLVSASCFPNDSPRIHTLSPLLINHPYFRVSQFVGAADTALADSITGFLEGFEGRIPSSLDRQSQYDDFRPSEKEYYAYSELPRSAY